MKFKFCGDLDCPDWALAAIALLTKLTSVKLRQLAQEVAKFIGDKESPLVNAIKICTDAKLASEDARIAVAAVEFFISKAVQNSVNPDTFCNELQQLGFPKEHAQSLSKVYQSSPGLTEAQRNDFPRVSKLVSVKCSPTTYIRMDGDSPAVDVVSMKTEMRIEQPDGSLRSFNFHMPVDKFLVLKHEVAEMLQIMDSLPI